MSRQCRLDGPWLRPPGFCWTAASHQAGRRPGLERGGQTEPGSRIEQSPGAGDHRGTNDPARMGVGFPLPSHPGASVHWAGGDSRPGRCATHIQGHRSCRSLCDWRPLELGSERRFPAPTVQGSGL